MVVERERETERRAMVVQAMMEGLRRYGDTPSPAVPCTIYRVPPILRECDPGAYTPQILSIGPFHRRNPKLRAMEEHKWRYLHNLLRRHQCDRAKALEACVEKVKASEERARRCYSEPVGPGSDDFVKMMVLDGCFILQLFLNLQHGPQEKDPIFDILWMVNAIMCDLLKLENQIPFFILQDLFDVLVAAPTSTPGTDVSLRDLAFRCLTDGKGAAAPLAKEQEVYHLLHLYHLVQRPKSEIGEPTDEPQATIACAQHLVRLVQLPKSEREPSSPRATIPCAVQLGDAGIQIEFKRNPEADTSASLLDVTFDFTQGKLLIPRLSIEDNTNSIFRNLIALEQCCPHTTGHFTIYVAFLDCLVDTHKDIAILEKNEVIDNYLGSQKEVAALINKLGKEVTMPMGSHYLAALFEDVNKYCGSKWHKHRTTLMRDYFNNPWAKISVAAATALLLMTAVQLTYAVLAYHKPQSP